jgi:hypothetical protein
VIFYVSDPDTPFLDPIPARDAMTFEVVRCVLSPTASYSRVIDMVAAGVVFTVTYIVTRAPKASLMSKRSFARPPRQPRSMPVCGGTSSTSAS